MVRLRSEGAFGNYRVSKNRDYGILYVFHYFSGFIIFLYLFHMSPIDLSYYGHYDYDRF